MCRCLYIIIYISCVCVCVCVCLKATSHKGSDTIVVKNMQTWLDDKCAIDLTVANCFRAEIHQPTTPNRIDSFFSPKDFPFH